MLWTLTQIEAWQDECMADDVAVVEGMTEWTEEQIRAYFESGGQLSVPHAEPLQLALYSFFEFMEDSLHHPAWGYYSDGRVQFGESAEAADFTTFPVSMRPMFGALIAERVHTIWQAGGSRGAPFVVLELGAGLGMLAHDFLQHCRVRRPNFYRSLTYVIGERSRSLRAEQEETNAGFVQEGRLFVREVDAQALADRSLRAALLELLGGIRCHAAWACRATPRSCPLPRPRSNRP